MALLKRGLDINGSTVVSLKVTETLISTVEKVKKLNSVSRKLLGHRHGHQPPPRELMVDVVECRNTRYSLEDFLGEH